MTFVLFQDSSEANSKLEYFKKNVHSTNSLKNSPATGITYLPIPFFDSINFTDDSGNSISLFVPFGLGQDQQMQRRVFGRLTGGIGSFRQRVNYYEELIDRFIIMPELSTLSALEALNNIIPDYDLSEIQFLLNAFSNIEVINNIGGEEFNFSLEVLANYISLDPNVDQVELNAVFQNIFELSFDFKISSVLKHTSSALDMLKYLKGSLVAKNVINSYVLIRAINMDLAYQRLMSLEAIIDEINDPAFEQAFYRSKNGLESLDESVWHQMIYALEQHLNDIIDSGLAISKASIATSLKGVGLKLTSGKFFSLVFTYKTALMINEHRDYARLATLSANLYKTFERNSGFDKESLEQQYSLYLYHSYWDLTFRNWTTAVLGVINPVWRDLRREFGDNHQRQYEIVLETMLYRLGFERSRITRRMALEICEVWTVANSGGVEGTTDIWDISILPQGIVLDIRYNMFRIPDKLTVEYPPVNEVLATGWRGDASYAGSRYPGGIAGVGRGQHLGIFQKQANDQFIVNVLGVDDGTRWEYQVRCRVP